MSDSVTGPNRSANGPLFNLTFFVDLPSLHFQESFFARDVCSMAIPTWTTAQANMSVGINGTYVPFKSAPDSMRRFVRPALFSTGDDVWELRLFGTAFLVTFHGWTFAIVTAHQTDVAKGAPAADQFVVVVKSGNRHLAVSPSSLHRPVIDDEDRQSLRDLTFFDYSESSAKAEHMDLSSVIWSDAADITADYSFLIGYPSSSAIIELDGDDDSKLSNFTMRWIRQDLKEDEPRPLDVEHRTIFVKHDRSTRESVEPDGLSGSPVFSIIKDKGNDRHLRFDGIVTHANGDRFAVYPSVYIRDMLEHIVQQAQRNGD
ncbi:hypothetical protein [Hoeflea sp. BAL378]|uniref:hypothetical protein n=1 Tax=Hoeflea sp. BAL378 TaxID=1547437 RepID=UPI001269FFA1|nr:hypothetical protein [Hoeflea sp. BAL378]